MEAFYKYTTKTKCWFRTNKWEEGQRATFPGSPFDVPKYFVCDDQAVEALRRKVLDGQLTKFDALTLLGPVVAPEAPVAPPADVQPEAPVPTRRGRSAGVSTIHSGEA